MILVYGSWWTNSVHFNLVSVTDRNIFLCEYYDLPLENSH